MVLLAVVATSLTFGSASAATPANDDFAQAAAIGSIPYTGSVDTTSSTAEIGEPNCGFYYGDNAQRTVWYAVTPSETKKIVVNAKSETMGTVLGVYSGPAVKELSYQACNWSGSGGATVRATWVAAAGTTYYIQIAGLNGASGVVTFNVTQPPPPANDNRADAIEIPYPLPFSGITDEIAGGTIEADEPRPSCGYFWATSSSVWYVLHAPAGANDSLEIDLFGSGGYPFGAIWKQNPNSSLSEAACFGYGAGRFTIQPNTTYYVQAIDEGYSWSGNGRLVVNLNHPIANDDFAAAADIELGEVQDIDVQRATREPSEPRPACVDNAPESVWYRFTAPRDMVVGMTATTGTNNYPEGWIAAYTGDDLATLRQAACKGPYSSAAGVELSAGDEIFIQAGVYYSNSSLMHITLSELPKAGHDDPEGAYDLTVLPELNSTYSESSTNARWSPGEPRPCGLANAGSTMWYSATFTLGERRIVSTRYSGYDTVLAIYKSDDLSHAVACNDDESASVTTSLIDFEFAPATTYLIEVGGVDRSRGNLSISVSLPPAPPAPPPSNDAFSQATAIGSLPFAAVGDTTGATLQAGEPQPSPACVATPDDPIVNNTIWYAFTPNRDVTLAMTVAGNTLNTLVTAYAGSALDALTQVACTGVVTAQGNNTRVQVATFAAHEGVTYFFQVGRRGTSNTGPAPFQLHEIPGDGS